MATSVRKKKIVLLGIALLVVIVLLTLSPILFLGKPQTFPREQISIQEIMLMGSVMQKFRKATAKDKQGKIRPQATIVLNADEVNMLIRSSMHFIPESKDTEWTASWNRQDGFLEVYISKKELFAALNISLYVLPAYHDRQLHFQCVFCKIGSVTISPKWVDPYLENLTEKLAECKEYKIAQSILIEAERIKPASLKVTFRPGSVNGQLPFLN